MITLTYIVLVLATNWDFSFFGLAIALVLDATLQIIKK